MDKPAHERHGILLPKNIADMLPTMVKTQIAQMTPELQQAFLEEYQRKARSTIVGYLLWLIGLHYAYVGKWGTQVIFWLTIGGLFVWWIIDLFRVPKIVQDYNIDRAIDVLRDLKITSG